MYDSCNDSKIYILTLNEDIINDRYMKSYFNYLYPSRECIINAETGKKEWIKTKKFNIWENDLIFDIDRSDVGKTLYTFRDKLCYCIAELGDQYKSGTPYLYMLDSIFKEIINSNKDKYQIEDVSDGFKLPINKRWEKNTGEKKEFTGYIDPRIKGILTGWLKKNNISIQEFLENPQYIIFMDSYFVDILNTLDYHDILSDKILDIYEV